MKLLIVDDNKEVRKLLNSLFAQKAEQIFECSDGQCAVESYEKYHPDYVLMDLEMKGMDGLTATEKIMNNNPGAKIIIVTSYNDPKLRKAGMSLGASAYVTKDNLIELEEIINK